MSRLAELKKLVEEDSRAFVTLEGELFGPAPLPQDDPSQPEAVRLVESRNSRYCPQLDSRTKLVAHRIAEIEPVPPAVPWNQVVGPSSAKDAMPQMKGGNLPHYPEQARVLGIEGTVVLQVEIEKGELREVGAISGDRVLVRAATDCAKSWRFNDTASGSLVSTFVFRLEKRLSGADPNPIIEARLPHFVETTAQEHGW